MVYLMIAGFALIIGGANWRFIVGTIGVLVVLVAAILLIDPVLDQLFGHDVLLKDYQKSRLTVFLDPTHDTSGDGYNLQQAKIAIGSGGLLQRLYAGNPVIFGLFTRGSDRLCFLRFGRGIWVYWRISFACFLHWPHCLLGERGKKFR